MTAYEIVEASEKQIKKQLEEVDDLVFYNSNKVLNAFKKNEINERCFDSTTGYGYNDLGREKLEQVYSDIFKCEAALVRSQLVSGSHALTVALFSQLRPGDTMLSISGLPYDTLHEVIGIKDNPSSLKSFKVEFDYIDLVKNENNDAENVNIFTNAVLSDRGKSAIKGAGYVENE